MTDTPSSPTVDDIWVSKDPALVAGKGFGWSSQARSLSGRHALLRAGIFAYVAVSVLTLILVVAMLYLFSQLGSEDIAENQMIGTIATIISVGGVYLPMGVVAVFIGCVIFYLMFVYRGMKNLHLSNARNLTTSPGWAVGWTFIPIANLGMIYSVMSQIWTGSHDPQRGAKSPPSTLGFWWGTWLASGFIGRIAEPMAPKEETLQFLDPSEYLSAFLPSLGISAVSTLMSIFSSFCLLAIIRQITDAQEILRSTAAFED